MQSIFTRLRTCMLIPVIALENADFAEELALDIDENIDDVQVTINYLLSVGLIESNNDDVYRLTYMETMVGSETAAAQRARDFREKKKALRCNNNVQKRNKCVTQASQIANVEKEIEIEKEIDKSIREKRKRFIPPTLEEVQAYVKERNSSVDPKRFFEYYETGGWKDAKGQSVKNWKQKLITWEKKDTSPKRKTQGFPEADTDLKELESRIFAN